MIEKKIRNTVLISDHGKIKGRTWQQIEDFRISYFYLFSRIVQESCHFSSLFSRNVRIFFCSLRYIKELSKLFTKTCKVRFWLIRFGYKMFLFRFFTYIFCSIKRFLKDKRDELLNELHIWIVRSSLHMTKSSCL